LEILVIIIYNKVKNRHGLKEEKQILITDSGLGGLSIFAEMVHKLEQAKHGKRFKLIYYNSLAHPDYGYNDMSTEDEKIRVFNNALQGMFDWYDPDLLLIACNTLSILYPKTKLAKSNVLDAKGILETGVNVIYQTLTESNDSKVILLGTETTINSRAYFDKLIERKIDSGRVISQSCKLLETEISIDFQSNRVFEMISKYLGEAKSKLGYVQDKIYIALCCTHYEYSVSQFKEEAERIFGNRVGIINPNSALVETKDVAGYPLADKKNKISLEIVSKNKIRETDLDSLEPLIASKSKNAARAFRNYIHNPNLFNY